MKYLLLEPAIHAKAYNIALMKYARWCENNNYEYQYVRGMVNPDIVPDEILMSCVFTYYSKKVEQTIDYYLKMFPNVHILVGGVFPTLNPEWFNKPKWANPIFGNSVDIHRFTDDRIEHLIPKWNVKVKDEDLYKTENLKRKAEEKYSSIVMYSSRGCVNKCGYCAVPKLEGKMKSFPTIKEYIETAKKELPNAKSIVLYDNNFTEHKYIFEICDELIESGLPVDIHGLHVDAFTPEIAEKFSQMKFGSQGKEHSTPYLRFSFDKMKYRDHIYRALTLCKQYNIKAEFFCYMLYNFTDKPLDFWKRMVYSQEIVNEVGKNITLFPQRYEPFAALEKYQYIGKYWTDATAKGVRRLATFLHGFLPISSSGNIFNWVGYTYEEFIERIEYIGNNPKERIVKKSGKPPNLEELKSTLKNRE